MIKTDIEGSFSVSIFRNNKEIKSTGRMKNLILEGAMDALDTLGPSLHVGTGTTAPTFSDTGLVSHLAAVNGSGWLESSPVLNGSTYEKESFNTFTFSTGAVVGNITELGVSPSPNPAIQFQTRALFRDGAGDPTTITVTAADQLVITYYVKKFITMIPTTSSVLSGGNVIDYTIRPCISTNGKSGSPAHFPASIYQAASNFGLFARINDANIISVDPVSYVPSFVDDSGETSPESSNAVTITATGNEVVHTITVPITTANFQWGAATVADTASSSLNEIIFQIEFNGPNYITKINTETVTFKIKEINNQVI